MPSPPPLDPPPPDPSPTLMEAADSPALGALIEQAEVAERADRTGEGLHLAEQAWARSAAAAPALRLRAGLALLRLRYRSGALWALVDAGLELVPLMRAQGALTAARRFDALRLLVLGAADVGRFEDAMRLGHEAHGVARDAGDAARMSLAINALGCVYERIGDPWHAEDLLLDALAQAQESGDTAAVSAARNNLAAILLGAYYLVGESGPAAEREALMVRALTHADEALKLARASGDRYPLVFALGNRGEVLVHLGRLEEAATELEASMGLCRESGFDAQAWRIAVSLGELGLRAAQPERAWEHLQWARQAIAGRNARNTLLRLHHAAWRAARALGWSQQALEQLERYQALEHERLLLQLRGRSQLFVTTIEAEQVRLEAARAAERAARAEVHARVDELTGLGNRRELEQRWPPLAQRLQAGQLPLALAMVDLDHFKQVNDRFGHAVGDAVLVTLARLLRENTRGDDLVIRTGGEEFLILLPEAGPERALEICERLCRRVSRYGWQALAPGLQVRLSVGLASAPPYDLRVLSERADAALYAAKRGGRDRVQLG